MLKTLFKIPMFSFKTLRAPLIEADELYQCMQNKETPLKILNSSMILPPDTGDKFQIWNKEKVPSAQLFDIDVIADTSSKYPHTMPSLDIWTTHMKRLNITKNDIVVIYDDFGIAAACRAYFMFQIFNHPNAFILNGGFNKWRQLKNNFFNYEPSQEENQTSEPYVFNHKLHFTLSQIQEASYLCKNNKGPFQIFDARGAPRFLAEVAEPRPGVRSGNIKGSKNIPFKKCLNDDNTFKSNQELEKVFQECDPSKIQVFTCGSGVTAAVLYVAQQLVGIFDGSWTEYGSVPEYNDEDVLKRLKTPEVHKQFPSEVMLEKGKQYSWCSCGRSQNLPFCDGLHRGTEFKPLKFIPQEEGKQWLCDCKQTQNKPFCDGSHNNLK